MSSRIVIHLSMIASFAAVLSCSDKELPREDHDHISETTYQQTAPDSSAIVQQYLAIAKQYVGEATYDSAMVYFEMAARLFEEKADWSSYVRSNNQQGKCAVEAGQYNRAAEILNEALTVGIESLGEETLEIAETYNFLGYNYWRQGENGKSLELHKKALKIQLEQISEQHPEVARSYFHLGLVYQRQNDLDRSIAFHELASKILTATLGKRHKRVAEVINSQAGNYWFKGDYEKAFDLSNTALSIWQETLEKQHPKIADCLGNIAIISALKGDYNKAIEYFEKSLVLKIAKLGEQHPQFANDLGNLAHTYQLKGDYESALVHGKKALALWKGSLDIEHPLVANHVNNLGVIYRHLGQYDKAIENHKRALAALLSRVGKQHIWVVEAYKNLGLAYLQKGDVSQSLKNFEHALRIGRETFGEFHPEIAAIYNHIAGIHLASQQFDLALENTQNAIRANIPTLLHDDPFLNPPLIDALSEQHLLTSLEEKAATLISRYAYSANEIRDMHVGVATYRHASRLIEKMRSGYKAEGSKLLLAERENEIYNDAIQAVLQLYELERKTEHQTLAFHFAEKSKSRIFLDALSDVKAKQFAGIPDSLLEQERQLRIDLAFYDRSLAEEQLKKEKADSAKVALWQDKVFALNQQYETMLTRFEKDYPDYYNLKYQTKTATMQDVQGLLDDNTALVEYFTGEDSIFIFTIAKETFDVVAVAKDSLFAQRTEELRDALINKDFEQYTQTAFQLYQTLVEPVKEQLSVENLIIVPDAEISTIPFEALLTQEFVQTSAGQPYHELPYLIDDFAISYAYSATLLLEMQQKQKMRAKKDYLAFAPVFPGGIPEDTRGADLLRENVKADSLRTSNRIRSYLPATREEVIGIQKVFAGRQSFFDRLFANKSSVYLEQEANEPNLKAPQLRDYRNVHFATHGFVNEQNPKLSGLLLAAEQDSTAKEDGIMHLGEIYNLEMNADLVVLSACETGLGQIARGEGIIGLTRGFLYAGAQNLLVSLWQVNDQTTAELMVDFYQNMLSGMLKSESLRHAKRQLIQSHPEYAKPYYWAPFILIGT